MESNGKFTLIVFNTCTQEYEEVIVTEEVYRTYCRTRWNIKDNDQSFFDHEIQTSGMIGSQDGAYENFREFIDAMGIASVQNPFTDRNMPYEQPFQPDAGDAEAVPIFVILSPIC